MNDQTKEKQLGWLAYTLDDALRLGVIQPAQILHHATPEVLAEKLPRELMVKVFASAFSTGKLTPEGILSVAPPATLVRHIDAGILWGCLRDAAAQHQIATPANVPKGRSPVRNWIADVITAGLERGLYTAGDVTRHIAPRDWVRDVPRELVARMITAGLGRPTFDPSVAIEILSPEAIGEHVSPHLAWALIDEGATRAFQLDAKSPAA